MLNLGLALENWIDTCCMKFLFTGVGIAGYSLGLVFSLMGWNVVGVCLEKPLLSLDLRDALDTFNVLA